MVCVINLHLTALGGRDSSVDVSDSLGAGRSGFETSCGQYFPYMSGVRPASFTMGMGVSVPGVKQPGCGVDHLLSSSTDEKESVELYLYSPLYAFMACYRVNFNLTVI